MKKIKVQIFRRTVKDRRRGDSYKLLYDFAEGVKAVGDDVEIVNEEMTGPTQDGEMEITAPIGVMFGYAIKKFLNFCYFMSNNNCSK